MYLGVSEPEDRGASGIVNALKKAPKTTFGETGPDLLSSVSSIVTDGASVNIGDKASLWALLQAARLKSATNEPNTTMPLLKAWCAAHRP